MDKDELEQVEDLFARWLEREGFRLLRDNAIVERISSRSFITHPVLAVSYAAFYGGYAKNQPVPVLIIYMIHDAAAQTTRTWFFVFYTPPEDLRELPHSLSIRADILYNKYGRGQSLLLECLGEVQECIDGILYPRTALHEISLEDLLRRLNIAIQVK